MGVAVFATFLALGAWLGVRYAEKSQQVDQDIARFLMSIPDEEWKR
jgi:hypothetical protein